MAYRSLEETCGDLDGIGKPHEKARPQKPERKRHPLQRKVAILEHEIRGYQLQLEACQPPDKPDAPGQTVRTLFSDGKWGVKCACGMSHGVDDEQGFGAEKLRCHGCTTLHHQPPARLFKGVKERFCWAIFIGRDEGCTGLTDWHYFFDRPEKARLHYEIYEGQWDTLTKRGE